MTTNLIFPRRWHRKNYVKYKMTAPYIPPKWYRVCKVWRRDECVFSIFEAKSISWLILVTRSYERHITGSLFRKIRQHGRRKIEDTERWHERSCQFTTFWLSLLVQELFDRVGQTSSTYHLHTKIFVYVWASHKCILSCKKIQRSVDLTISRVDRFYQSTNYALEQVYPKQVSASFIRLKMKSY